MGYQRVLEDDPEIALELHVFFQQLFHAMNRQQKDFAVGQRSGCVNGRNAFCQAMKIAHPPAGHGELAYVINAVLIGIVGHQAARMNVDHVAGRLTAFFQEFTLLKLARNEQGDEIVCFGFIQRNVPAYLGENTGGVHDRQK